MKHMRRQHAGERKALTKRKELEVHQALAAEGFQFDYQLHLPFAGCGLASETSCSYADFCLGAPWGHIVLEVDEGEHAAYDPSCDPRRDGDIFASAALGNGGCVVILRYNPDSFTVGVLKCNAPKKQRHARLARALRELMSEEPPAHKRLFLYYSRAAADDVLPLVAQHWEPSVRELSRCLADE